MSQLSDIVSAQKNLEECFMKKMNDLETQIQSAGTGKETVTRVAEEFRTFRELVFSMLGLLRKQINQCSNQLDAVETRHRHKALIFLGVAESESENCKETVFGILKTKMGLKDISKSSLSVCHRLGASTGHEHHRPVLVKFSEYDVKSAVWRAKTTLKGTNISVKEFLTKYRQEVFNNARVHFGVRSCWTQDGVIHIKTSDNERHKVVKRDDLNSLIARFPRESSSVGSRPGPARRNK
ncbi:unnamed protein product [Diatraea saccharalis]|uniref:Uncharacterized protein n=1 Tax=Diatraea saccharalis TaxID=40085 RepID=A0A9N9REH0_9NEOP|nr:unnamed protein product [Diatraea saccharalis]